MAPVCNGTEQSIHEVCELNIIEFKSHVRDSGYVSYTSSEITWTEFYCIQGICFQLFNHAVFYPRKVK